MFFGGVAPAIIGGVSAVSGIASSAKARGDAKKAQEQQTKLIERQEALNKLQVQGQQQELDFQFQREEAVARANKDVAVFQNDIQGMQADAATTQAQIEAQTAKMQNEQKRLMKLAAANTQAGQVFQQIEQQTGQIADQALQAEAQIAAEQSGRAAAGNQVESFSDLLDDERKAEMLEDMQGGFAEDAIERASQALTQLGYEDSTANVEKLLGDLAIDFTNRQIERQDQIADIQSDANATNIDLQGQRNTAARTFGKRTAEATLATAQNSADISFAAQKQQAEQQRAASSPSLLPSLIGAAQSGFQIFNTVRSRNIDVPSRPPSPGQPRAAFPNSTLGNESAIYPNVGEFNTPSFDPYGNFLTQPGTSSQVSGSTYGDVFTEAGSQSSLTPSTPVMSVF